MTADILTLHTALTSRAEASRRRAMLLHPSNFIPDSSAGREGGQKADELAARFECVYEELMDRGLPEGEARTEVVGIAAREVWDGFASRLRRHRAVGDQMDANVLAVALSSIQGLPLSLVRRPGNLAYASRAISAARRRLQFNGGLLEKLHAHTSPAFSEAAKTFEWLEFFLGTVAGNGGVTAAALIQSPRGTTAGGTA